MLLDLVSDRQVGGWENVMESPDHKGTWRLWRRCGIYSERKTRGKGKDLTYVLKRLLWRKTLPETRTKQRHQLGRCFKIPGERWWGLRGGSSGLVRSGQIMDIF